MFDVDSFSLRIPSLLSYSHCRGSPNFNTRDTWGITFLIESLVFFHGLKKKRINHIGIICEFLDMSFVCDLLRLCISGEIISYLINYFWATGCFWFCLGSKIGSYLNIQVSGSCGLQLYCTSGPWNFALSSPRGTELDNIVNSECCYGAI